MARWESAGLGLEGQQLLRVVRDAPCSRRVEVVSVASATYAKAQSWLPGNSEGGGDANKGVPHGWTGAALW